MKIKTKALLVVLEPIHLTCNLRLNPKPENDGTNYQIPKVDLRVILESLSLSVTKKQVINVRSEPVFFYLRGLLQYEGIVLFADALDTMTLKAKYRKYEPSEHPIKFGSNAKDW